VTEGKTYLAVDLGAESGRVIAGTILGGKLDLQEINKFPNGAHKGDDGHYHWETPRLFEDIKKGLKLAQQKYGESLVSVGVDTWGVDYGLFGEEGELLNIPFHYRDERTKGMMEKAFGKMPKDEIYRRTGIQFMELNTVFQLMAEDPEKLQKARRLLFTPDLISYWLCGQAINESTIASTSQLLNAKEGTWDNELLAALDIPRHLFGELTPPATNLGEVTEKIAGETGCTGLKVVAVGGHDTASAVAAVPFDDPSTSAYLSSGTWSLLGIESDQPLIDPEAKFTNEWGLEGTFRVLQNIVGLWIIQECRRAWAEEGHDYNYETLKQMSAKANPFFALLDVDYGPLMEVGGMPGKICDYLKQTGQEVPEASDHGQIIRIATEGLALKYARVLDELESLKGSPIKTLNIVGGGSQNTLLNQMTANATGRNVVTGPTEGTAAGNILAQLLADGSISSLREGRELIKRTFELSNYYPEEVESWKAARIQLHGIMNQ
jgi:rhamnulokinase